MPKFDCVNKPSRIGPKLYFDVCQFTRRSWLSDPSPVHQLAIAKHDLHTAGKAEMIEVGRIAGALVERVAEHAALRRPGGHVKHQLVAAPDQLIIHRLVAHAGLDHCEAKPLVDLEDAIHPVAEIHHDLSGVRGGTAAEPDIIAGADRIERHAMRVGAADDLLHVGSRGRVNHAGWRPVAARHSVLAVTAQRLLAAVDGVGADRGGDFAEERVERGGHDCLAGLVLTRFRCSWPLRSRPARRVPARAA
jgi:hypothetical protein